MTDLLLVTAAVVAAVAGARSTWSPCGLSMLSTITPVAERARGHRWGATATWFVVGALAGGATVGLAMAGLTALAMAVPDQEAAAIAAIAALAAAASDAGVAGFHLPVHRRQVNERWLDGYRPWVYGTGFGWQIGAGVVTYIKTAGVYLMIVLAVLTGRPLAALAIGILFGLVRGTAVFLARGITSPTALAEFHRRFMRAGTVALGVVIGVELATVLVFAAALSPWAAMIAAVTVTAVAAVRRSDGSRSARTA